LTVVQEHHDQRPATAPSSDAPAYVGGLDGLRAIAVVAVMLYHFSKDRLPAGFLGVDVFFVVSGFLISRLVVWEMFRTDRLSMLRFWARRARRLLPALGVVTLATLVAIAFTFSPIDLVDVRAQVIGTLLYCANWVIIFTHGSYFAAVGRPSPFLHMWSLAVEEQFYIVFPLVCFCARRWIIAHPVRAASVAVAGAVASTAWMWYLVKPLSDPTRAYLGTDSHAMGLLIGVALGIVAAARTPWERGTAWLTANARTARAYDALAWVTLLAIVLTMCWSGDSSYRLYRGGFLAFSIACGVVIVALVAVPGSTIARALRSPPLVAIGLRSYSLYLWHWPVRVIVEPHGGFTGWRVFMVRAVLSVGLAEISYRWVERPFRVGVVARNLGTRAAVAFFVVLGLLSLALVTTKDAPPPAPLIALAHLKQQDLNGLRVDVFGDSTGLVFGVAGAANSEKLHVNVGGDARNGCGLVHTDHFAPGQVISSSKKCSRYQQRWARIIRDGRNAINVLMTGAWDLLDQRVNGHTIRFGTQAWTDLVTGSVRDAVATLTATGKPVFVFEVPCYGDGDPSRPKLDRADPNRIDAMNRIYAQLAAENPRIRIIHWRSLVCPNGHRIEKLHGKQLWEHDDVHLTSEGAIEVWNWLLPQLH
jgi:peptidoglycan/LPS O-acetylase OafA/YrhL